MEELENLNELDNLDFFDDEYQSHAEIDLEERQKDSEELDSPLHEADTDDDDDDDTDNNEESDAITDYLLSKGIDINSIKMQNDDGETEEVKFSDLSKEEQLQILNYNPNEDDNEGPELAEDEERLLGILRNNNMSVQDYLNAYKRHVIEQYQATLQQEEPTYDIDEYTDEELFIADLKDKVPDLTEEEALQELELQQQNPALFKKKVDGLRAIYQEREKQLKEQEEQEEQQRQAQLAAQFESVIVDTIQNNNSIDLGDTSLELSEDDMNEIASFILDSDAAGVRHIAKALNDPKMLVEMAWWALKGHDALNQVTQYYKKQISEARKSAKASTPVIPAKPKTVVTKPSKKQSESKSYNEYDLYDNLI